MTINYTKEQREQAAALAHKLRELQVPSATRREANNVVRMGVRAALFWNRLKEEVKAGRVRG